jgi:hypothetical protein
MYKILECKRKVLMGKDLSRAKRAARARIAGGRRPVIMPRIYSDCTAEFKQRVKTAAVEARMNETAWVLRAAEEKLRAQRAESGTGVLRDLSPRDQALVRDLADMLRTHKENTLLRDVIDAQRLVLALLVK